MTKTLQKKFVFTAMLAVSLLLVALLGAINIGNAAITSRQTNALLNALVEAETAFTPIRPQPKHDRNSPFSPALTEDHRLSARYFVVLTDASGTILKLDISRIASVTEPEASAILSQVLQSAKTQGRVAHFRYRSVEISNGSGQVYVFLDVSAQGLAVLRVLLLSILLGVLCWVVMLLLVSLLSKKAIQPIAASMERQRQFVTDAGHELKTPLAIIQANTEAMELLNGETKWSRNIREQTQRLGSLMNELLALSRLDEYDLHAERSLQDLSGIVDGGIQMFLPGAELKELRIHKQIAPGITVSGSLDLLNRLISILMDNAVKYTPPGGEIRIRLSALQQTILLTVENECHSLPDCPPDKLFDRFFRADAARTQKNGGYGIGLSSAKAIVEAHGGTICAQYLDDSAIAFQIKLNAGGFP